MTQEPKSFREVSDGDYCRIVRGTHAGSPEIVQDRKTSKTGHVTITVRENDGDRLKALARNVVGQSATGLGIRYSHSEIIA